MKTSQLLAVSGLALAAALSSQAQAAVGCVTTPFSTWTSGPCVEQDLTYTLISYDAQFGAALATTAVVIDNPVVGTDKHQIDFTQLVGTITPAGTYKFKYSVEINATDPNGFFNRAWLSSNTDVASGGSTTFTAHYFSDAFTTSIGSVQSLNSGTSGELSVYGYKKLWVESTYVYTSPATVNSATDYLIMTVPEPATLTLIGLGVAGLGFGSRRRKAAA